MENASGRNPPRRTALRLPGLSGLLPDCLFGCLLLSLSGCLFSPTGDSPQPIGRAGKTFALQIRDGRLLVADPDSLVIYCDLDRLKTEPSQIDTLAYEMTGDSLFFIAPIASLDSAVARTVSKYARTGAGSGLNGIWKWVAVVHELSGTASARDSADYRALDEANRETLALHTNSLWIRDGKLTDYSDRTPAEGFTEGFLGNQAPPPVGDGSAYDVIVQTIGDSTVVLVGDLTKQRVRIVLSWNGDREYSSENPALPVHTYRERPTACPNALEPEWYFPFLQANPKPTAKASP